MSEEIVEYQVFPEDAVILADEPLPNITVEEIQHDIRSISTTQELVELYAEVHNKFWFIEDEVYDYEENTEEYNSICDKVNCWGIVLDELTSKITTIAVEEKLLAEEHLNTQAVKLIEPFMKKYGYKNGCGWWVKL